MKHKEDSQRLSTMADETLESSQKIVSEPCPAGCVITDSNGRYKLNADATIHFSKSIHSWN